MRWLWMLACFLKAFFRDRVELAVENLALHQQLSIYNQKMKLPRLNWRDRSFWVTLSKLWSKWKSVLAIVQPETVIGWHRRLFKVYWTLKSRRRKKPGRPKVSKEIQKLTADMTRDNFTWGAPRIVKDLALLGYTVSEATVRRYRDRSTKPPSQTWRIFLKSHMDVTVAIDFFTVPTAGFSVLYVFIIIEHSRRKILHFNVTYHPTAEWTTRQVKEAFPWDTSPRFLLRDNDKIYGKTFINAVKDMDIEEVPISPYCPWQIQYEMTPLRGRWSFEDRQLVLKCETLIKEENLGAGDRFLSADGIAASFKCSNITGRRVLGELERKGIIEKSRGKGCIVKAPLFNGEEILLVVGCHRDNEKEHFSYIQSALYKGVLEECFAKGSISKIVTLEYLKRLPSEKAANAIILQFHHGFDPEAASAIQRENVNCVCCQSLESVEGASTIMIDLRKGAYHAVSHLALQGHERIAIFIGSKSRTGGIGDRFDGYYQALKDGGVGFDPELVKSVELDVWNRNKYRASHENALDDLLDMEDPPTAVFCTADIISMPLLEHCKRRGISVPGTLAISGFDNLPETELTKVYLQAIIDNYSRRILAWSVEAKLEPGRTVVLIWKAFKQKGQTGDAQSLMVDGGIENINHAVNELCDQGLLKRILAQTDVHFSNSMIEAFWRALKHQWLYLNNMDNIAAVRRLVGFYIAEYNKTLPHAALNGLTPDEAYYGTGEHVQEELELGKKNAREARLEANRALACETCKEAWGGFASVN